MLHSVMEARFQIFSGARGFRFYRAQTARRAAMSGVASHGSTRTRVIAAQDGTFQRIVEAS